MLRAHRLSTSLGLGVIAIAVAAAGCSSSSNNPGSQSTSAAGSNTLVIANAVRVDTLDPEANSVNESIWMDQNLYSRLLQPNSTGTGLLPDLATSWTIAPNGLTYTFHLRTDAKFCNGQPVLASDVVYSIDRSRKFAGGWGFLLTPVKAVTAPDAQNEYYASSLTINGQPDQRLSTSYGYLSQGATLDWTLSPTATGWGSAPPDAPPSYTAGTSATIGYLGSQTATVAPGGSTTITVGASNATGAPQQVKVSITAPSGVTITPTSATIEVPPHGTGTTTLTVAADASTTQNYYSAPVTLTTKSTGAPASLNQTILVAAAGSLLSTFNNEGISNDSDPSTADFDGCGYSYSAQALASATSPKARNLA